MGGNTTATTLPKWLRAIAIGRNPVWTLVRVLVLVFGTVLIFKFVLTPPIRVTGVSMLPTYHDGQINFINRLSYLRHEPRRGDVVGVRGFSGESLMLMKRIVGLPGETISFANGAIFIGGKQLDEPYVIYSSNWERPSMQLGPTEYYVVGDNRSMPFLDHKQGAVDRKRIVGRLLFHGSS